MQIEEFYYTQLYFQKSNITAAQNSMVMYIAWFMIPGALHLLADAFIYKIFSLWLFSELCLLVDMQRH